MIKLNHKYKLSHGERAVRNIKRRVENISSIIRYKLSPEHFTRNRKMSFAKTIYYTLNKKGLTSKMEISEFNELLDCEDISSSAVLKQREKYSADIFIDLLRENLLDFYFNFKEDVKLYKNKYVLIAIDGTDMEIPNTKTSREYARPKKQKREEEVPRLHISNAFDVLNHFIVDTNIGLEHTSEQLQAEEHLEIIKSYDLPFPIIRIMDRGYVSIRDIFYSVQNDDKFIIRLKSKDFDEEQRKVLSDDAEVDLNLIKRLKYYEKYYKDIDPEFIKLAKSQKTVKVRITKIRLSTGEAEYLISNLGKQEFTKNELRELYGLRWQIELNYHILKESLKIEAITSSKPELIRQDIYSGMLAFNTLQTFINDSNYKIDQSKYLHHMKINTNMAAGFFKKYFILAIIEMGTPKASYYLDQMRAHIEKYLEPVRKGRNYERKKDKKNKYSINKRKAF